VPKKEPLKKKIMDEAHTSGYSIHPGNTNMYHNLRQEVWWTRMKHEIAHYVSECDTCRKVKANYIATTEYSRVDAGRYEHGLHSGLTIDGPPSLIQFG
jgi:hypothetical protein